MGGAVELSEYSLVQLEKKEHQSRLVKNLSGRWFELKKGVLGNQYLGMNEITNLKESYTNIYVNSLEDLKKNEQELREIISNSYNNSNLDWSYVEVMFNYDITSQIKDNYSFADHSLYSTSIYKEIFPDLAKQQDHPSPEITFRMGSNKDEADIIECLITAYFNGLHKDMKEQINEKEIVSNVEALYNPFLTKSRYAFIADINNQFIGHGSIETLTSSVDPDVTIANLIDILVLDDYRNTGIAKYLANIIEAYCATKGIKFLSGTVESENNFIKYEKILSSLLAEKWNVSSLIYSKNLSEES